MSKKLEGQLRCEPCAETTGHSISLGIAEDGSETRMSVELRQVVARNPGGGYRLDCGHVVPLVMMLSAQEYVDDPEIGKRIDGTGTPLLTVWKRHNPQFEMREPSGDDWIT